MRRKTTFTQFQDSLRDENALLPAMQWKKKGAFCSESGPAEDFPRLERSAGVSGRRGWQWEKVRECGLVLSRRGLVKSVIVVEGNVWMPVMGFLN